MWRLWRSNQRCVMLSKLAYDAFVDDFVYTIDDVEIGTLDNLRNQAVEYLWTYTDEIFADVVASVLFGKTSQCLTERMDDVYNFLFYLELIFKQRVEDYANGNQYDQQYYADAYCLDTITKQMTCEELSADAIRRIYNLYYISFSGPIIKPGIEESGIQDNDNPAIVY